MRSIARTVWTATLVTLVFTVLLGIVYPLVITGVAQLALPWQANGSLVTDSDGEVVGSGLIGQSFTDAAGEPLPEYFQPRPSAVDYDAAASSGSNLGPESLDLIAAVEERRVEIAEFNGVDEADVPPDAVTASGSGLDPNISPEYADLQVERVAAARGLSAAQVRELVGRHTHGPDLGFLGEPRVDVVRLNLALDELAGDE